MRIFLTGATGVIGRRVVPLLVHGGHQVTAIGRTPDKRQRLEQMGAAAVEVDLFDSGAFQRILPGHDAVINLATHMPSSTTRMMLPGSWKENDRVRREGSAILAAEASSARVRIFIQESFAPMYEAAGDHWIDETWPIRPARYNRSTVDAERSAGRFTEGGGSGIVLRFAGFYGPDAFHVRDMIKLVRKGWFPLPGSPDAYISAVSHDDAASAVIAALDAPAGIYNVTDDDPLPRRDFAGTLATALGVKPPRFLPPWMAFLMGSIGELLSRSQRMSNRKLKAATGWQPRYPSVREGWPATLAGMRQSTKNPQTQ
jgi:nucleoside-diphosphate-sugar epimerase